MQSGDRILVGQGVYKPSSQSSPIDLRTEVSIQGGYAGVGAADPNARDIVAYPSILSGDLGNNDPVFTDNAARVVRIPGGTQPPAQTGDFANRANLDGFTIRDAHATSSMTVQGGGVTASAVSPPGTSAIIRDCKITDNRANDGGGVAIQSGALVTFRQCEIYENDAVHGISIGSGRGGAFYVAGTVKLLDCWVHDNEAVAAGGGGMVFVSSSTTSKVVSSIIQDNVADENGGGILLTSSTGTLELINSLLVGNSSDGSGGAIAAGALNLQMTNCTVSGNSADTGGGIYYASSSTTSTIKNSILWDNTATISDPEIDLTGSGTLTVSYSDIEGGWGGAGSNNINSNPQFVGSGDYHLLCGSPPSPCINAGSDAAVSSDSEDVNENDDEMEDTPDLDLSYRIVNVVDMGAYEKPQQTASCFASIAPSPCPDAVVDTDDLLLVINSWGACAAPCPADLAGSSGVVDTDDLLVIINNWGACEGASQSECEDICELTFPDDPDALNNCIQECAGR